MTGKSIVEPGVGGKEKIPETGTIDMSFTRDFWYTASVQG
jgi:hypothetical protein